MQATPSSFNLTPPMGDKTMAVVAGFPQRADAGAAREARSRRRREEGAAGLRHDAGHLLGALQMYSELMTTPGVLSDEYRHLAQELQVLSDRSAAVLGRLMTLGAAAMLPANTGAEMEATVLPDAVLELLGLLSRMAGRGVTFFCSPSAYLPVAVSRSGFERILVNLVKNAAEAGPASGTVAVTLVGMHDRAQDALVLVLTVQGRGRGSSSGRVRSVTTGRGLADEDVRSSIGFQVVRELAESSGAKVELESELEAGTSVSVSWPAINPRRRRPEVIGEPLSVNLRLSGLELPEETAAVALTGGEAC